ncbi:MAG: site-specific DNA-methyltransferase, partial [Bacilli bacterium]
MKILNQYQGENYVMYHADCIDAIAGIPDESIHYSIFSPPFSNLFTYSNSDRDLGNSKSDAEFYEHLNFLCAGLFRVMKRGRLVSIHCMDSLATITHDGFIGLKDMPGII